MLLGGAIGHYEVSLTEEIFLVFLTCRPYNRLAAFACFCCVGTFHLLLLLFASDHCLYCSLQGTKCKKVSSNANLTPDCAKWFFPIGVSVRDNFVYMNGRVGIQWAGGCASKFEGGEQPGCGTQVYNNHVEVKKDSMCYSVDGKNLAKGSATNENRGYDQGGYGSNVTANTGHINRQKVQGGYLTTDGEGVLHQASSNSDMMYTLWNENNLEGGSSGYMLAYKLQEPSHNVITSNQVISSENIGCLAGNGGNCGKENECKDNHPKCVGF